MRKVVSFIVAAALVTCCTAPSWAAEQNPQREVGPPKPTKDVSIAVAAALFNVVYAPVRFATSTVMAGVGGAIGWLNGGDSESARSIWDNTDGQAFITPAILERREQLRFGKP